MEWSIYFPHKVARKIFLKEFILRKKATIWSHDYFWDDSLHSKINSSKKFQNANIFQNYKNLKDAVFDFENFWDFFHPFFIFIVPYFIFKNSITVWFYVFIALCWWFYSWWIIDIIIGLSILWKLEASQDSTSSNEQEIDGVSPQDLPFFTLRIYSSEWLNY